MTVSTQTSRVEYIGNGATTAFAVPFYFLANGDLKVYQAGALKTITTHYTVSGAGNQSGGTVTFVSAPGSGETVVLFRDPALTQSTDYPPNDPFPAESHERALDRLTMISQRLNDKLNQAILIPDSEQFGGVLPAKANRANRYMTFDANGNPSVSSTDIDAFVQQANDAASASADSAAASAASASAAADSASAVAGTESIINAALADFIAAESSIIASFETFSGTGSQTVFTLSVTPTNEDVIDVYISGVYQQKSQYTLSGSAITFSAAPPSGTNNIEVKIAPQVAYQVIDDSEWGLLASGVQVQRRRGSTAQHSSFTGAEGEMTVDTTKKTVVVHDGTTAGGFPAAREDHNHSGVYQPYDADLDTWSTKTAPTGTVVGDSDTQTLTNKTIQDPVIVGTIKEGVFTITDGSSVDIDPSNGSVQLWTLGANRSPTASSFAAGEAVTLMINDGSARTITWPSVTWVGGSAPTLATSGYTVIELWKVGTTLYGALVGSVA